MVASVHSWQLVHSATSMIMFHLDIAIPPADHPSRRPLRGLLRMRSVNGPHPEEAALFARPSRRMATQQLSHPSLEPFYHGDAASPLLFARLAAKAQCLTSRDDQSTDLA